LKVDDNRKRPLRVAWEEVVGRLSGEGNMPAAAKEKDFFTLVEEARQEWQAAMSYFNHIVEPDLVDHAIHAMVAAEKKYMFLLKKARQEEYCLSGKLDELRGGRGSSGY
jgi:hypothetical protein